jgi:hypothetical protein
MLVFWVSALAGATNALAALSTTVSFTTAGCSTWAVPVGVSSVSIAAIGAAGPVFNAASTAAGLGDKVSAVLSGLTGGSSTLDVCVNQGGGETLFIDSNVPGGAGGGASGVSIGSDFADPVVVAGGDSQDPGGG